MYNDNKDIFRLIDYTKCSDVQYLLRLSKCLITDYSSIHYDYLLIDRPILFIPYDINEYIKNTSGFNCNYNDFTAGPKITNGKDFFNSIKHALCDKSYYSEERKRVRELVHTYHDNNSSERSYSALKNLINI